MKTDYPFLVPAIAAFAVTASIIPLAARADAPMAIVRPGDGAMTCPALAEEINALAQSQAPVAAGAKKKHGFGFLKVLGAVVSGVGMLDGVAGGLVSSAAAAGSAVADTGARDQIGDVNAAARAAMAGGSAMQQRKARLMTLFDDHHC